MAAYVRHATATNSKETPTFLQLHDTTTRRICQGEICGADYCFRRGGARPLPQEATRASPTKSEWHRAFPDYPWRQNACSCLCRFCETHFCVVVPFRLEITIITITRSAWQVGQTFVSVNGTSGAESSSLHYSLPAIIIP